MFTVLIAEKEHIDAIRQENKLFFEPFLESKELAFCYWNPAGQDLNDSVPGLLDAVGRKKAWRAVIINNSTPETAKLRNPFDLTDYSAIKDMVSPRSEPDGKEAVEEWEAQWKTYFDALTEAKTEIYKSALEQPLQRLSTWLCFRPEDYILSDVQEKQDLHDWALVELGRESEKPSTRLENLERAQYRKELRLKETLRRAFVADNYLDIAYPTELHCLSIRTADSSFFDPEDFWNVRRDSEYSVFADRNMFFDKMRFLVFDLKTRTHRDFRTDYIRFLATVLIFASNPVPSSVMQTRRLYRLEAETDDTPLCTLVTSYDKKLASTASVIENEMDKIRGEIPGALSDKQVEAMFCTPKDVAVLLDESCDEDSVYAEQDYGLFFDRPENEYQKWGRSYRKSRKALAYIVKQQSRAIRKSVSQMQFSSEVSDVNISRLTPLQIEDIRDYTDGEEDAMVASIPPDLSDISRYTKRLAEAEADVKQVIQRRMTQKTTLVLSAICLGLYFLCFLPFLLSNNGTPKTITTAIILIGVMLAAFTGILAVSLFFLRSALVNAVKAYNNTAGEVMDEIRQSMDKFSTYLSAACNVRRGHGVQNYANENVDVYTRSLRIRKKHLEDIRKKRAYLAEEYRDYFGDSSFCDEAMSRPYTYDFDQRKEYAYPAPFLAGDSRQIEFLGGGNFVTVPSSYITGITVRMEGIYE